jgi:hypothetical protein
VKVKLWCMNNGQEAAAKKFCGRQMKSQEISSPKQYSTAGTPDIRTIMVEYNLSTSS